MEIGTLIVGALGPIITLIISSLYQYFVKKDDREHEIKILKFNAEMDLNKQKREKFADFLAAYWKSHNVLLEMISVMQAKSEGWRESVNDLWNSEVYLKSVDEMNALVGWISLLSENKNSVTLARNLEKKYDKVISDIENLTDPSKDLDSAEVGATDKKMDELEECAFRLSDALANEGSFTEGIKSLSSN